MIEVFLSRFECFPPLVKGIFYLGLACAFISVVAFFKYKPVTPPISSAKQTKPLSASRRSSITMTGITAEGNGGDGINIDGSINVDMKNVKTKNNKGRGINIVSKPTDSK